jgi:excinuclease ABC subunit A
VSNQLIAEPGSTTSRTSRSTCPAMPSSSSPACPAPASPASPSTRSSPRGSAVTSSRSARTPASSSARWTSPTSTSSRGCRPAVSIDQKSTSRNPRSTVGTITEVYDYLRLLYARIGRPHCPNCGPDRTADPAADRRSCPGSRRVRASRCSHRSSAVARASTSTCSSNCRHRASSRARVDGETTNSADAAQTGQAEEAHHRGRDRPARGQGEQQARPDRLASRPRCNSPGPGRLRLRRPRREASRRENSRSPRHLACPTTMASSRRARAAQFSFNSPSARARPARPRHPDGGRPRTRHPRPDREHRRGRDRALVERARRRVLPQAAQRARRRGRLRPRHAVGGRSRPRPEGDPLRPPHQGARQVTTNRYGRQREYYYAAYEGVQPTSSAATVRPSPTPAASGSRASCARCRVRPAPAAGSSRSRSAVTLPATTAKNIAEVCAMPIGETSDFLRTLDLSERERRSPSGCSRRSTSGCASCSTSGSTT